MADPTDREKVRQAFERMRAATDRIHQIPRIPWWRLRDRRRCTHAERLCVHGDSINMMNGARAVCVDCGCRFVDLPVECAFTGQPHPSMVEGQ